MRTVFALSDQPINLAVTKARAILRRGLLEDFRGELKTCDTHSIMVKLNKNDLH